LLALCLSPNRDETRDEGAFGTRLMAAQNRERAERVVKAGESNYAQKRQGRESERKREKAGSREMFAIKIVTAVL